MVKPDANTKQEPIVVTVTEKKCGKCGVTKPVTDFWKQRSSKDGLQPQCKNCQLGLATDFVPVKKVKAEKPAKPAKKEKPAKKTKAVPVETNKIECGTTDATPLQDQPVTETKSKKKAQIGSGRRKECLGCAYVVASTEGGQCINEAAINDTDKDAAKCSHREQSKKSSKKASKKE